jgi:PmbA protein
MVFSEMEGTIKDICSSVAKGDVISSYSHSRPVDFEMDHLKSIEDISRFSIGLRVFGGGRVGNSFINSLDDKDILINNALESSSLGDEIDFDLPGALDFKPMNTFYPGVKDYDEHKAVKIGDEIIKRLKSIDSEAKVNAGISASYSRNYLTNTNGFWGSYDSTFFSVSAGMLLVDEAQGGGLLSVDEGDASYNDDVDIENICSTIEWRYKNALNKVSMNTGYFPVLFSPDALGLLLESIEIAANAKTLFKGISVLSGKTGQIIADPSFSITDNPLLENGLGSYPFDDEGVLPGVLPIIENGVFKNFIYDLTTAKRLNARSTGHGSRSTASMPSPSFSNLVVGTGSSSFEEMIGSIKYGLYVCEFLGGGMSNMIAGDFSVNVELGYLVENGHVSGRVKDTMLSGNVYDLLKDIEAIESRTHKKGSLYAPHILFRKASITG